MKIGNLVSVKRTHGRKPVIGLVTEIIEDDYNRVVLVQSIKSERHVYANPIDIEVINDCG